MAGAVLWPFGERWAASQSRSETLANGITLGTPWPPRLEYPNEHPVVPAYLVDPPAVIPIDVGRQLFVDDFLIEDTTMARTFHHAVYHPANPVLRPEKPWELRDETAERINRPPNPAAMVFSDGVFYDPRARIFKMWYMAGYLRYTCLATSTDGVTWQRPELDVVAGTNIVGTTFRDSSTVWLDQFTGDPRQRFKMSAWHDHVLQLFVSPDGIHWTKIGATGRAGDRSTFFYNPFRRVWVFSIRDTQDAGGVFGRYRRYWEAPDFGSAREWSQRPPVAWVKSDSRDLASPGVSTPAELYNLDGVAYESLTVGLFSIWRGESSAREKINEIALGFSRDGFHWDRPDRRSFIPVANVEGSWNWANVQSAGGGCVVVGDSLYFYVSGRQGRPGTEEPGVCSTGLAVLRRDGFASMDWLPEQARVRRDVLGRRSLGEGGPSAEGGTLTTRPVQFSGEHLFVNADLGGGELRAEVLDREGRVIEPLTRQACVPAKGDGTRMKVSWNGGSLKPLAGRPVRIRFSMSRGRLYAFWISRWPTGESGGYPAGGGPEFSGAIDTRIG